MNRVTGTWWSKPEDRKKDLHTELDVLEDILADARYELMRLEELLDRFCEQKIEFPVRIPVVVW